MPKNKSTIVLLASAVILFAGLVSLVSATVNVGDDFNFQSVYRILNASSSSFLGGLSVGTSTAQSPGVLYVTGNLTSGGSFSGSLSAVNVSSGIFGSTAGKGNFTFQAAANTDPVLFVDATNERVGVGTSTPAYTLSVGGTSYYSATSTFMGNVGIGTTSPGQKLDIIGLARINTGNNDNYSLAIGNGTAKNGIYVDSNDYGLYSLKRIYVVDTSNSSQFSGGVNLATASGYVGIGTTTPSSIFDIVGSAPVVKILDTGSNLGYLQYGNTTANLYLGVERTGGGGIIAGSVAGSAVFNMAQNLPMYFGTNSTIQMTILGSGNVGIGTSTPGSKLTVAGNLLITGTNNGITFPDNSVATSTGGVPKGMQAFTSTGTFTVPTGVTRVWVKVQGGGGGGGGANPNNFGAGGGGAGGYSEGLVAVTPNQQITVTIGTGGAGDAGCGGGSSGNQSSFGSSIVSNGGGGGACSTTSNLNTGGAGGTASGGSVNIAGGPGENGTEAASNYKGGTGGGSSFGGGGGGGGYFGGWAMSAISPSANSGAGGGGGAAYTGASAAGTAGAGGIVIVYW